jgi:hypothetical protein
MASYSLIETPEPTDQILLDALPSQRKQYRQLTVVVRRNMTHEEVDDLIRRLRAARKAMDAPSPAKYSF